MPYKPGRKVRVGRPIRIDEDEMCRRARGRSPGQVLRRSVVATAAPGAGGCTGLVRTYSMIAAPHGTSESAAGDRASQKVARVQPPPRLCSLAPCITTPLYSTTVS